MFGDRTAQAAALQEIGFCAIKELDSPAWPLLIDHLRMSGDPGAVVAFVDALSTALATFPASDSEIAGIASLRASVALIVASPDWTSGRWRRHANSRGNGGHHSGNISDRPVLTSLVAHLLPTPEQATVDGLRLLMLMTVLQTGPGSTAVIQVADAARKAVTIETWRQVIRSLPSPGHTTTCLFGWLSLVMGYLKTATPPSGLANLPAQSIQVFFASLHQLVAAALQLPLLRELTPSTVRAPDEAEDEAVGVLTAIPRRTPVDRPHLATSNQGADDDVVERNEPVQEVLAFTEGPAGYGEAAHLPVVVQDGLASHEHAPANCAATVELRHATFRIAQMQQRLLWDWDHLNPFDLSLVASGIRTDLRQRGPRWRGALIVATMLVFGRRAKFVGELGLGGPSSTSDWVDHTGNWQHRIPRPPNAWNASSSLTDSLVARADVVELLLDEIIRTAFLAAMQAEPKAVTLSQALNFAAEEVIEIVSDWLAPLRVQHPSGRLTHGRISRTLAALMVSGGATNVHVHMLTGTAEDVPPVACYYASLSASDLRSTYHRAIEKIFPDHQALAEAPALHVGAPVLAPEAISTWVAALRNDVLTSTERWKQHNAYCIYILVHLLAATGHRPVGDPFESLDLFVLEQGLVFVADKSSHQTGEARLIPLCDLSMKLLRHYVEHLERLARWVNTAQPELSWQIESVLAPHGPRALPLFFLLDEGGCVQRISNRELSATTPDILRDLPANQFRRELATAAMGQGWDHELIEEILGHIDLGQCAFDAQTSLSPAQFEVLRPLLGRYLAEQGWTDLASPLPAGPSRRGRPLSRAQPSPLLMGIVQRSQNAMRAVRRADTRMEDTLRRWCKGRDWLSVSQTDLDSLRLDMLNGKSKPSTESELRWLHRVDRLARWVKRRYDLAHLRLPPTRMQQASPASFTVDEMALYRRWLDLRAAFPQLLKARSRAKSSVAPERQMAEAIVSLALHSLLSDESVLRCLMQRVPWQLVDVPGVAILLSVDAPFTGSTASTTRRYPIDPLSCALLSRVSPTAAKSERWPESVKRAVETLLTALFQYRPTTAMPSGGSLAQLCRVCAVAARMQLPGHLAAYLDGTVGAASLAAPDWERWISGGAAQNDKRDAALYNTRPEEFLDRPAEPLLPGNPGKSAGEQRAKALALHRAVVKISAGTERLAVSRREDSNRSVNQIERALPPLCKEFERHPDAPEFVRALVQWLIRLMEHGLHGHQLRFTTCKRYYTALIWPVIDHLHGLRLRTVTEDSLVQAYAAVLEQVSQRGQAMLLGRLREFHAFLVTEHGAPPVEWSDVAPEGVWRTLTPDAGLVLWPEYRCALHMLLNDPTSDLREQYMQAFVLVLMYRFGLRALEALGLRRIDLIFQDNKWIVLVRPNDYRELKTDSGVRQVPQIGPLDPVEEQVIRSWHEHADETVGLDRLGALISQQGAPRHLVDRDRLMRRLTEALRQASGSNSVRPHHLRHSFTSRLVMLMSLPAVPVEPAALAVTQRLLGPCDPEATRTLMLGTPQLSKRCLWAMAVAVGHSAPSTSLRWYTHVHDWLLALSAGSVFQKLCVRLDVRTASYVLGKRLTASAHKISIDIEWVRRQRPPRVKRMHAGLAEMTCLGNLPTRKPAEAVVPDLTTVDRLLEIVHRRGRADALLCQRLMLAPEQVANFLQHDHAVREHAGYHVPQSGWIPTSAASAVNHIRAGTRQPVETERVRALLRSLSEKLNDPQWLDLSAKACAVWRNRYRAHSTPLVVTSIDEAATVLRWCVHSGLEPDTLVLLVPPDNAALMPSVVGISVERAPLASARTRYRSQNSSRVGLQLRENHKGPLTHMTQLHRTLHVVSTWLQSRLTN